jgi:hypothetical protein
MTIYFQNTNYGTFCLLEKDLISNFIKNNITITDEQKVKTIIEKNGVFNIK